MFTVLFLIMGAKEKYNKGIFIDLEKNHKIDSFNILFKLYYEKLLFVAVNYVNNKEVAEELVQDVFVRIWQKKEDITLNTNINSYLFISIKNACLDYLKSKKYKLSKNTSLLQEEALINFNAFSDDAASSMIEKELEKQIFIAIEALPAKCRKVFIKSRIDGLKYKEISEELEISTKTVENHISKALKHFRIQLREFLSFF